MSDSMHTTTELDSYGVWVKRTGIHHTSLAAETDTPDGSVDTEPLAGFASDLPEMTEPVSDDVAQSGTEYAASDAAPSLDSFTPDFADSDDRASSERADIDTAVESSSDELPAQGTSLLDTFIQHFGLGDTPATTAASSAVAAEQTDDRDTAATPVPFDTESPAAALDVDTPADIAEVLSDGRVSTAAAQQAEPPIDYNLSVSNDAEAAPHPTVLGAEPPAAQLSSADTTILNQIVADLAHLKEEISSLKVSFEALKDKAVSAETASPADGFFSGHDEDDTISLSGNELSTIMTTAAFSAADTGTATDGGGGIDIPAASDSDSSGFFSDSNGDESIALSGNELSHIMDNADFAATEKTDSLPETAAPEADDIALPDFSDTADTTIDFTDENLIEPDLSNIDMNESIPDELPDEISVPKVDDILLDSSPTDFMDSVQETDFPARPYDVPSELPDDTIDVIEPLTLDNAKGIDILAADPDIQDTLTETKMDYLRADENAAFETGVNVDEIPNDLQSEIKSVLLYMDRLLENLPEDKIVEFAKSEQFNTYKKLFTDLGLS